MRCGRRRGIVDYLPPAVPHASSTWPTGDAWSCPQLPKFFGLAGLRLGYAIADEAPSAPHGRRRALQRELLALAAGLASLRATKAADRRRREVADARGVLLEGLRAAGTEPYPSEANFVLTRVDVDDMLVARELARSGILVRPGAEFGLPRHLRITVGPTPLMERVTSEPARRAPPSGPVVARIPATRVSARAGSKRPGGQRSSSLRHPVVGRRRRRPAVVRARHRGRHGSTPESARRRDAERRVRPLDVAAATERGVWVQRPRLLRRGDGRSCARARPPRPRHRRARPKRADGELGSEAAGPCAGSRTCGSA
jgi:hypothetical protein